MPANPSGWKRPRVRRRPGEQNETSTSLECYLHCDLHDAGVECGGDLAEGSGVQRGIGAVKTRVVQDIEGFPADIDFEALLDGKGSPEGGIDIPSRRTNDGVAAHVSERAGGLAGERGSVEPRPDARVGEV